LAQGQIGPAALKSFCLNELDIHLLAFALLKAVHLPEIRSKLKARQLSAHKNPAFSSSAISATFAFFFAQNPVSSKILWPTPPTN